ncbi:caspase family protein [Flavivirga rizhaonensis]|uniref:Caspase family protein n=1 Tax=Flavivirga rizhaonensis TaxID=2559571 RepID=A0A4S1E492_9FLAO|nr:caspase family protein [Flavivirga rizhaonensis]TGV04832.1 caspase family protein [Flavivirga rizhaonensis]
MKFHYIFFILVFLNSSLLVGQESYIETNGPVSNSTLSADGKFLAYSPMFGGKHLYGDTVYLVNLDKFNIVDSIQVFNDEDREIKSIQFKGSSNTEIMVKTELGGYYYYKALYEHPLDSIFIIDFNNKQKPKEVYPGHIRLDFSLKTNDAVIATNLHKAKPVNKETPPYYELKKNAEISFKENTVKTFSGIRQIKLSPNNKYLAVIYFIKEQNDSLFYGLETRRLPDLEVLARKEIIHRPEKIEFSSNGKYLALTKNQNPIYSTNAYEIIEILKTENLSHPKSEKDIFIGNKIINGNAWVMRFGITLYDYFNFDDDFNSDVKKRIENIDNVTLFEKIEDTLLIFSDKSFRKPNQSIDSTKYKNILYKYPVRDNSLFDDQPSVNLIDTLYKKESVKILNNTLSSRMQMQLGQNGEYILTHNKYQIQIWSVKERKKLCDYKFKRPIKVFLNNDSNSCLFFEESSMNEYDDFNQDINSTIGIIDFKTGLVKRRKLNYYEDNMIKFKPNENLECVNLKINNNSWYCYENQFYKTTEKLFYVNQDSLFVDIELSQKKAIKHLKSLLASNQVIFQSVSEKDNINYLYLYDVFKKKRTKVPNSGDILLRPLNTYHFFSESKIIYKQNNELVVLDIFDGSKTIIQREYKDYISGVVLDKDHTTIFSQSKDTINYHLKVKNLIFNNKTNRLLKDNHINNLESTSNRSVHDNDIISRDYNSLISVNPINDSIYEWNSKTTLNTWDKPQVLANGILKYDDFVINLNNLRTIDNKLKNISSTSIFKNSENNSLVLYVKYNADDKNFTFRISKLSNLNDFIWESKSFDLEYMPYHKIIISQDYKIAATIATVNDGSDKLFIIDLENFKIKEKTLDIGSLTFYYQKATTFFSDDGKYLCLKSKNYDNNSREKYYNDKTHFINIETLEIEKSTYNNIFKLYNDGSILASDGYSDYAKGRLEKDTLKIDTKFYGIWNKSIIKYLKSENKYVSANENGELYVWNENGKSPLMIIDLKSSAECKDIIQSRRRLFVFLDNSEIKVINLDTFALELTIVLSEKRSKKGVERSVLYVTPEGYFSSTKNNIRDYHFVKNLKAYPLINYSVFLNRPDIILNRLGYANKKVIKLYKNYYLKRLAKNGLSEQIDLLSIEAPKISIINKENIQSTVRLEKIPMSFNVSNNSEKINIYVNGVGVFSKDSIFESIINYEIELNNGKNVITAITTNKEGVESDPEIITINNTLKRTHTKVHYFGIGVSKYKDSNWNLKYAVNDVNKLEEYLKSRFGSGIKINTYFNESVTSSNLMSIKEKLLQTNVDDIVIISFSGHGLLDQEDNFYFATHNTDFENPKSKGFSYEEIYNLLNYIPARKKLLLLDTCYSGEKNDTDLESFISTSNKLKEYDVNTRGSKGILRKSYKELQTLRDLFYDLNRGNGSYIIAATGGKQFALESEKWNNGVFTYSFIKAMEDLETLKISELKDLTYKNVLELTDGFQKPTTRTDNIEWDWVLE